MSTAPAPAYDLAPYPNVDETTGEELDGHPSSAHTDCTEATIVDLAAWADRAIPATPATRERLDLAHLPVDTGHTTADSLEQCRAVFGRELHRAGSWADLRVLLDSGVVRAAIDGWYLNRDGSRGGHRVCIGPRLAPDVYVFADPMGTRDVLTWGEVMTGAARFRWGGVRLVSPSLAPVYTVAHEWEGPVYTVTPAAPGELVAAAAANVNVRSYPDEGLAAGSRIATVKAGVALGPLTGTAPSAKYGTGSPWLEVTLTDGRRGYVQASVARRLPAPPAPPDPRISRAAELASELVAALSTPQEGA